MDLSVIIVNRNAKDLLKECLLSISQDRAMSIEIWVVDNASTDDSVQMVQTEFPQVKLIVNKENLGFARANNQALTRSTGRYRLLLNPDTVVPTGVLDYLVQFMENTPDAGVAGCAQIYPDGRRQVTCHRDITLMRETFVAFGLARVFRGVFGYSGSDKFSNPRQVDWVEGGALLIRDATLAIVGGLDEGYFIYVEDADFCFRVRQANLGVYFVPNVHIIHDRGQTTGLEQRGSRRLRVNSKLLIAMHQSKVRYIRKHCGAWQSKVYLLLVCVYSLRKLCMGLILRSLRKIEREMWNNLSRAYIALLTADLEQGVSQLDN